MEVFYFTTAQYAINNLALRRLKVARYRDLNDPFELRAVSIDDAVTQKAFDSKNTEIDESEGLICFTAEWRNPLMWSHYADKHKGVALAFEVPDTELHEVHYQRRLTAPPKGSGSDEMERLFKRLRIAKFEDWQYEEEHRQFFQLKSLHGEDGLYFVPFGENLKLTQVMLGPRCSLQPGTLGALVQPIDGSIRITQTKIAAQGFEIVNAASSTAAVLTMSNFGAQQRVVNRRRKKRSSNSLFSGDLGRALQAFSQSNAAKPGSGA